jgi:hypothetical protein
MEKKIWTVINPHDPITFVATEHEAALIAERLLPGLYFVENAETKEEPVVDDLRAWYDKLWFSKDAILSLADAYDSFLVGDRAEFEEKVKGAGPEKRAILHAEWHAEERGSLEDICAKFWEAGAKIRVTEPDDPNTIPLAAG